MVAVLKFENKPLRIRWYLLNPRYTTTLLVSTSYTAKPLFSGPFLSLIRQKLNSSSILYDRFHLK